MTTPTHRCVNCKREWQETQLEVWQGFPVQQRCPECKSACAKMDPVPTTPPEDEKRWAELAREANGRADALLSGMNASRMPDGKHFPSDIRAVLSFAKWYADRAYLDRPRWQGIESAPRDGMDVLVGRFVSDPSADKNGYIAVDWWRSHKEAGGYIGWGKFNMQYFPPTHWMPLPTPPTEPSHG